VIRNVIFDWSGTLCNDMPPVLAGINGVLGDFGIDALSEAEFREAFCLPYENFYRALLPDDSDWDLEDLERRYVAHYDEKENPAIEIAGAVAFFQFCRDSGRKIFLLSAVKQAHFEGQAKNFGFEIAAFEEVFTEVRDKREVILELVDAHTLDPEQTLMVGDMVHDIDAGRAAGVRSVAVLTGYDSKQRLAGANPDVMVRNLTELRALMSSLELIPN
jgi:phosphoglycolate phosphatase